MKKQLGYTLVEIWIFFLSIAVIIGYVWNIVKLVGIVYDPITGMFVLRCVGVFIPPLGAIIGFL